MPAFLAPLLIGLATSGIGLAGSKMGANAARNAAELQRQQFTQMMARSQPAFDKAYGYYSGLLSGDPSKIMEAAGPEISATNLQFTQAAKNILEGAQARGGSLSRALANLEAGKAYNISNLLQGVRPMAAQNLSALARGDQAAGLQALAGSQQSAFQDAYMRQNALINIGGFLTRLLTSPELFSRGQQQDPTYKSPFHAPGPKPWPHWTLPEALTTNTIAQSSPAVTSAFPRLIPYGRK